MSSDLKKWWNKKHYVNKGFIILGIVVLVGVVFPPPTNNWWTDTYTGRIAYVPFKAIFDMVSQNTVSTFQCIDERDGSVVGYSAFDAQVGLLQCQK